MRNQPNASRLKDSDRTVEVPVADLPDAEKVRRLNDAIQGLHFSHNEVRRLVPQWVAAVTELVAPVPKAKAKAPKDSE